MERIRIPLPSGEYPIYIESGLIMKAGELIEGKELVVITDAQVDALYGETLIQGLKTPPVIKYVVPPGESSKSFSQVEGIMSLMLDHQISRKGVIIALGGGVVGDLAGFAASIYMRGIDYYQVPTTLLAQVDSSVGGKTGINMPQGKNMVGSFYQPKGVIIDPMVLKTLPMKQVVSGMGEVVKYGFIEDYSFHQYLKTHLEELLALDQAHLTRVIKRCCEIKAAITLADEREQGRRKILNFGHTLGHALEAATDYQVYAHGEAVIEGMRYEGALAHLLGHISADYYQEMEALLRAFPMDRSPLPLPEELLSYMEVDKKNQGKGISFILPVGKGQVQEFHFHREFLKEILLKMQEVLP